MIEYILQVQGQDLLQVVYTSGANRFITPDSWGCYGSNMTRTQREFMNKSIMVTLPPTGCYRAINYYLDGEHPNAAIMSAVRAAERREEEKRRAKK